MGNLATFPKHHIHDSFINNALSFQFDDTCNPLSKRNKPRAGRLKESMGEGLLMEKSFLGDHVARWLGHTLRIQ